MGFANDEFLIKQHNSQVTKNIVKYNKNLGDTNVRKINERTETIAKDALKYTERKMTMNMEEAAKKTEEIRQYWEGK